MVTQQHPTDQNPRRAMTETVDEPQQSAAAEPQHGIVPRGDGLRGTAVATGDDIVAEARELVKVYGSDKTQVVALDRVSVSFRRGSFTAIMGPSGSGKSTLMHCLAGLDRITDGQVFLAGEELNRLPDSKLTNVRRDRLGFVFQSFNLLPTLTARQNIVLPLDLAGKRPDEAYFTQLTQSLGLTERLAHRPSELSGGQQQRVAIARAMVTRPDVIFADEPTGALDSKTGTALLDYLRRSVDDLGQSIIMVTHDPKAAAYADRVLVLLDGHIVDDLADPDVDQVTHALASLER
ncbi:ABC transporter ATP-binding protein [Aestuariimicrobium soli]|uniref:ABC transporter ATP-binding protein n=1 Tax=Aestuariimicrobium soli TaxID=2035834 RepID=UPI003EBD7BED